MRYADLRPGDVIVTSEEGLMCLQVIVDKLYVSIIWMFLWSTWLRAGQIQPAWHNLSKEQNIEGYQVFRCDD